METVVGQRFRLQVGYTSAAKQIHGENGAFLNQ
jgi:hypothetical protein